MADDKSNEPLFEWIPPLVWIRRTAAPLASWLLIVEAAIGGFGALASYLVIGSIVLSISVLLFAIAIGFVGKRRLPHINAVTFRAMAERLEIKAASKGMYIPYSSISSCEVEHRRVEGEAFALLNLTLKEEYRARRKWWRVGKTKSIPVDEGWKLEAVKQILGREGVSVIDRGRLNRGTN